MTKLVIHAGTHKTGTTSLQKAFATSYDLLSKNGVYYPLNWRFFYKSPPESQSKNAHFGFARALANPTGNAKKSLEKFHNDLCEKAKTHHTILLSAESIYRHVDAMNAPIGTNWSEEERRRLYLQRLKQYFSEFSTSILLFFRRPDMLAESLYGEVIANTNRFPTFPAHLVNSQHFYDYSTKIIQFKEYFSVNLINYEHACATDLLKTAYKYISDEVEPPKLANNFRTSLSKSAVLWLRRTKFEKSGKMSEIERRRRWLFALQRSSAHYFDTPTGASYFGNAFSRQLFYENSVENLRDIDFLAPDSSGFCQAQWNDIQHNESEKAFVDWQEKHIKLLVEREAAKIEPFILTGFEEQNS
ncbi:hypothetical protein [Roseibium sp.]|uniref:hypothetical protein n=1 Tax=Roseibium sp. TaxID=1936156 RepID=UPI003BACF09F